MALTYGFYNSVEGDRAYTAEQFGDLFDGILEDGVYQTFGDIFAVSQNIGMMVEVGSGRAWLRGTWTKNDTELLVSVDDSELSTDRIDTVVLSVNHDPDIRRNEIYVKKGTPGASPVAPTLINEEDHQEYPLADIYVAAEATSIIQANITNRVGTAALPFVTGVLETMTIEAITSQWESEWDFWTNEQSGIFQAWFANLENQLTEQQAANFQFQINTINEKITYVQLVCIEFETLCLVKTGVHYLVTPESFDGQNLVYCHARSITPGVTGTMNIQIRNRTTLTNMLSTPMTIDSDENGTETAAVPPVISSVNKQVSWQDLIRIDIDAIHTGTAAKGLIVTLGFQIPAV